jgi:hemerythrin
MRSGITRRRIAAVEEIMPNNESLIKIREALCNHDVLFTWKPQYELGISILDEQHRAIVATINSFNYAIQNDLGNSVLAPINSMIHEYTRIHFALEESYLSLCVYPEGKRHCSLHTKLLQKLSVVGNESLWRQDPHHLLQFLKDWWIDHICVEDFLFRDYLHMAFRNLPADL